MGFAKHIHGLARFPKYIIGLSAAATLIGGTVLLK